ncbi:MAG: hypothetical protein HC836_43330 [Richelia sp. RM2_1_2]|nr:hypothetical protein [Richelia sp. RM2_1_2]
MKKYWSILIGLCLISLIASCRQDSGSSSENGSSSTDYYQPVTPSQPTYTAPAPPPVKPIHPNYGDCHHYSC